MTLSSSSYCSSVKYNVLPNWVNPQPKRKDPRQNILVKVPIFTLNILLWAFSKFFLFSRLGTSKTGKLQKVFFISIDFPSPYQFRFRKSKAGASLATKYFRVSLLYYRYDVIAVPPLHFSFYDVHMTEDNLKSPEKI